MARPKYTKADANQSELADALRQLGFVVFDVHDLAHLGCDLLVIGMHRRWLLPMVLMVEVKAEGGTLTDGEKAVRDELRERYGDDAPWIVARKAEDVLDWFNARD